MNSFCLWTRYRIPRWPDNTEQISKVLKSLSCENMISLCLLHIFSNHYTFYYSFSFKNAKCHIYFTVHRLFKCLKKLTNPLSEWRVWQSAGRNVPGHWPGSCFGLADPLPPTQGKCCAKIQPAVCQHSINHEEAVSISNIQNLTLSKIF